MKIAFVAKCEIHNVQVSIYMDDGILIAVNACPECEDTFTGPILTFSKPSEDEKEGGR